MAIKTYGPIEELTSISGTIRSGGEGNISAFDGTTFLAKLKSSSYTKGYEYADGEYGKIDYLRVYVVSGPYYMIAFHTENDKTRNNGYGMHASSLANWGITAIQNPSIGVGDYIDVSTVYSPKSKQIKKLYGSVNGQTKEIKKLYGSVSGQTKRIF